MKISNIEIISTNIPLREPYIQADWTMNYLTYVIVRIETNDGIIGYGEAAPDPFFTGETRETVIGVLKNQLCPRLINFDPYNISQFHVEIANKIRGNSSAKAAIEMALFDIIGKDLGVPISKLIGAPLRSKLPLTHVIDLKDTKKAAEEALEDIKKGFTILKAKVGLGIKDDWDRIKKIRNVVGEEIRIKVDANQGWKNYSTAIKAIKMLEPLDIESIEQPIYRWDIKGLAKLRKSTHIPIIVDEGSCTPQDAIRIIREDAADIIDIKLMKSGGIYNALKINAIVEASGLQSQMGTMVETSIATAAAAHFAACQNNIAYYELIGPLLCKEDVGKIKIEKNFLKVPHKPGLGIEIFEDVIEKLSTETIEIKSS